MKFFKILWNELKKEFFSTWSYKWQWLGEFVCLIIFFFFLNSLSQEIRMTGVSYCIWVYSVLVIGDISSKISLEMRSGTLEQIYLSSISPVILYISKVITSIFRSVFMAGLFLLFLMLSGYTNPLSISQRCIYIVFSITPGLFGISFLLGGLTILLKDISWFANIINNSFLFLGGIFLSLESFPAFLQKISVMIPTTQAIIAFKQSDFTACQFFMIIAVNFLYLILGVFFYFFCEKQAATKGILGHY